MSIFGFLIIIGLVMVENDFALGILLPPILFGIAILPPLLALSWFIGNKPVVVTYRQGFVALAGGTTVSIFLTFIVVSMVVSVVFALVQNFASSLLDQLDSVNILEANSLSTLLGNWNYVYVFFVVTFIIPVAAELCKSLVILPVLGRFSPQDAFLVGSAAGAGFAIVSNLIVAGWGLAVWWGAFVVLLLSGAINPFYAGFMAIGWHKILYKHAQAWTDWTIRLCIAIIIHAFWNGGSFLIILTLTDTERFTGQFWGTAPEGILAVGFTFTVLVVLGLGVYQMGRITTERLSTSPAEELWSDFSEKTLAMWALASLVIIVPPGLVWLHFLSE